jgi:hypothetical protein
MSVRTEIKVCACYIRIERTTTTTHIEFKNIVKERFMR